MSIHLGRGFFLLPIPLTFTCSSPISLITVITLHLIDNSGSPSFTTTRASPYAEVDRPYHYSLREQLRYTLSTVFPSFPLSALVAPTLPIPTKLRTFTSPARLHSPLHAAGSRQAGPRSGLHRCHSAPALLSRLKNSYTTHFAASRTEVRSGWRREAACGVIRAVLDGRFSAR